MAKTPTKATRKTPAAKTKADPAVAPRAARKEALTAHQDELTAKKAATADQFAEADAKAEPDAAAIEELQVGLQVRGY